jgi:hypothetical protein
MLALMGGDNERQRQDRAATKGRFLAAMGGIGFRRRPLRVHGFAAEQHLTMTDDDRSFPWKRGFSRGIISTAVTLIIV